MLSTAAAAAKVVRARHYHDPPFDEIRIIKKADDFHVECFYKNRLATAYVLAANGDQDGSYDETRIKLRDRFKTSEISDNEWRYGYDVWYRKRGETIASDFLNTPRLNEALLIVATSLANQTAWHTVVTRVCDHCSAAAEQSAAPACRWQPDDDSHETASLCSQPGCALEATRVYKFKRIFDDLTRVQPESRLNGDGLALMFCDAHADRGNYAYDDTNDNYECVFGGDYRTAITPSDKISPAAFGGVIGIEGLMDFLSET